MSVLKISNLVKRFEGVVAVDDLSFSVSPGEIFGFLGGNGAGKTTTLRMVLDIIRPTSGTISVLGSPPDRRNAQAIGFLPEERGLYAGMSAIDTIVYFGRLKGMKPADARSRGMELLSRFDLADRAKSDIGDMSKGMAQKVQLATSLVNDPELLMLDEPLGSLDRSLRERLTADLGALLRRLGLAALHVTHDHDEAFALADRIAVMGGGRIDRIGTPDEVWADPGTVHAARCLGHENLVVLDADGECALGRLGSGSGTVLVRADGLSVGPVGGGVDAIVASVARRAGRLVATVVVGDLSVRVPLADGHDAGVGSTLRTGDWVGLVVAAGAAVRLVD